MLLWTFLLHSIGNIDISRENSSIGDQNLNQLNASNKEAGCFTELQTFRLKNSKNLSHLNINLLRNKLESIKPIISPNFDIFLVSGTKLDKYFPNNHFSISGYRMFRLDRNCLGRSLWICVKDNTASKQLNLHLDKETEVIYLEKNIQLRQWLIVGLYKLPCQNNSLILENMTKNLSRYLDSYKNKTLLGDFTMNSEDKTFYRYFQSWTSDKWTNLLQRKSKLHRSHHQ